MNTAALPQDIPERPDQVEARLVQRRLFTYSVKALRMAQKTENIYVKHADFQQALTACDRIYQLSRELSTPQGLLITGPTGSGKSTLFDYFVRSLPQTELFAIGKGAITVRLQHRQTVGQLVSGLLRKLDYPFAEVSNKTVYIKRNLMMDSLIQKGTKLLFIDEGHYLGSQIVYRNFLGIESSITDLLREIMDYVGLGLVIAADPSFCGLEHLDPALASRVAGRMKLSEFALSPAWFGFVKAYCAQLPDFDMSILLDPEIGRLTHVATRGSPRHFRQLTIEAVLIAVDVGATALDLKMLHQAYGLVFGTDCALPNPYAS